MSERPQNKHLESGVHLDALGVTPMTAGQKTGTVRVRAQAEALAWFTASFDSASRGELVERLYAAHLRGEL